MNAPDDNDDPKPLTAAEYTLHQAARRLLARAYRHDQTGMRMHSVAGAEREFLIASVLRAVAKGLMGSAEDTP